MVQKALRICFAVVLTSIIAIPSLHADPRAELVRKFVLQLIKYSGSSGGCTLLEGDLLRLYGKSSLEFALRGDLASALRGSPFLSQLEKGIESGDRAQLAALLQSDPALYRDLTGSLSDSELQYLGILELSAVSQSLSLFSLPDQRSSPELMTMEVDDSLAIEPPDTLNPPPTFSALTADPLAKRSVEASGADALSPALARPSEDSKAQTAESESLTDEQVRGFRQVLDSSRYLALWEDDPARGLEILRSYFGTDSDGRPVLIDIHYDAKDQKEVGRFVFPAETALQITQAFDKIFQARIAWATKALRDANLLAKNLALSDEKALEILLLHHLPFDAENPRLGLRARIENSNLLTRDELDLLMRRGVLGPALESYLARPDILSLTPKAHPELNSNWAEMKNAHLEAIAELLEMYPDYELYFLARDSEYLYDFAKLMTKNEPKELQRIHLINVSRANMNDARLKAYLAQEGISEESLRAGKRVLFVDTGFSGTISMKIESLFPADLHSQFATQLMASSHSNHPSTRVFLGMLNPEAPKLDPAAMHGTIVAYEHMPRYVDRSTHFEKRGGVLHAVSPADSQTDGIVSKEIATKYMEDLAAFAGLKSTQRRFNEMRLLWRELYALAKSGSKELLLSKLRGLLLTQAPQDGFAEGIVRDLIEILSTNHPHQKDLTIDFAIQYEFRNPETGKVKSVGFTKEELTLLEPALEASENGALHASDVQTFAKSLNRELLEKLKILAQTQEKGNFASVDGGQTGAPEKRVLMLDLDDTVLKEVDVNRYRNHPHVQSIHYRPSAAICARYQQRILEGPQPGKVIHFDLHGDGTMTGYVVVRPELAHFFEAISNEINAGRLRIFIASSNDPARTEAMVESLRIGSKTLQEWGCEVAGKEKFESSGGGKNIAKLRKELSIPDEEKIIAVDDLPDQYQGISAEDKVIGVTPWDLQRSESYLKDPESVSEAEEFNTLLEGFSGLKDSTQLSQENRITTLARILFGESSLTGHSGTQGRWELAFIRVGSPVTISLEEVGLSPIGGSRQGSQKLELIKKYPQWAKILEDPASQIPKLIKKEDFGTLGAILDVYWDEEVIDLIFKSLAHTLSTSIKKGFVEALVKISQTQGWSKSAIKKAFEYGVAEFIEIYIAQYLLKQDGVNSEIRREVLKGLFAMGGEKLAEIGSESSQVSTFVQGYLQIANSDLAIGRTLSLCLHSEEEGYRAFGEELLGLENSDWKNEPVVAAYLEIARSSQQRLAPFPEAAIEWLTRADVSPELKAQFLLSNLGVEVDEPPHPGPLPQGGEGKISSPLEGEDKGGGVPLYVRYRDSMPQAEREAVLKVIDETTSLPLYETLAQQQGEQVLHRFYEVAKPESFLYISFQFPKKGVQFRMGEEDEAHDVVLTRSFEMQATSLTQLQVALLLGENPSKFKTSGESWTLGGKEVQIDANRPAENLSYNDIQKLILKRLNQLDPHRQYRLPTEAEREYAARGGSDTTYSFGDDDGELFQYGWFNENSGRKTQEVARLKPNAFGLFDMHGNVWEWCQDWYGDYPKGKVVDPQGPKTGSNRVFRGGSWDLNPQLLRSADRYVVSPGYRGYGIGFRPVRTRP